MQPGISSNSGSQPHQATVTVSFLAFNGPEDRNIRGQTTLGSGNGPASYTIYKNELVVMDRRYAAPGHTPAVFSSLSGLEYDPRAGDAGLNRRLAAVGVAINHIHFNAASGLANQRVTVVTNGLVPIAWTSEFIDPPSPGDLVVAYPPSTDAAVRENQLQKVSDNAAGSRYQGDIVGDSRTPMLMRKFTGAEMDDLPIEALEYFISNYQKWLPFQSENPDTRDLTPVQSFAVYIIYAPLAIAAINQYGRDLSQMERFITRSVCINWSTYMTTQKTMAWLEKVTSANPLSEGEKNMGEAWRAALLSYRNLLLGCMTSVIGRIVGTRIDGMVPIFLG